VRTRIRLERFYDGMAAEIELAGGTVEKFAGDAVMAAFGAPEATGKASRTGPWPRR
jgi:class 3 adenylate cyclase